MIYDEYQAITIASDGDGLVLRERSLTAAVVRSLISLFPLGVGFLVVVVFLGPGAPRPVGDGLSALMAWGLIGLFFTALGLLPIVGGICLIGLRSEYIVRQSERRLRAATRWFGLVIWCRSRSFGEFQQVRVRHVRRGPFAGRWQFVVSCEGASASVEIVSCSDYQRARMVAESMAGQMGLPVEFE